MSPETFLALVTLGSVAFTFSAGFIAGRAWAAWRVRRQAAQIAARLEAADTTPPAGMPEARCIACGCTDSHACEGGCRWIWVDRAAQQGLCSACGDTLSERDLAQAANELVDLAERNGMCVRISRAPLQPLAMGHARHEVEIWPARNHVHSGEKPHA